MEERFSNNKHGFDIQNPTLSLMIAQLMFHINELIVYCARILAVIERIEEGIRGAEKTED